MLLPAVVDRRALFGERAYGLAEVLRGHQACQLWPQGREGRRLAFLFVAVHGRDGRAYPERRGRGDRARELQRALQLLPGRGNGLDQSVMLSLLGVPGFAGQHEPHGVAVADLADQPDGGAAAGVQPQQCLVLGEDRVAGRHAHVGARKSS